MSGRTSWLSVLVAATALVAVGCGADDTEDARGGAASGSSAVAAAGAVVKTARELGQKPPDATSRPIAPDKRIAIIGFTEANESAAIPDRSALEAAKEAGWTAKVYDARQNVGAVTGLVRQAIAAGADGIITSTIDCAWGAQGFKEAKARRIPVVPINGFDCDDKFSSGGPGPSLFTADIATSGRTLGEFYEKAGQYVAAAAIAQTGDKAKVVSVENDELAALRWIQKGFNDTIEESGGSEVVGKVTFTTNDFVKGRVVTMIQSELSRHPEATHVKSPFTSATVAGVAPAVKTAGSDVKILGSEGQASEFDMLRSGELTATATTPGAWTGWAAVDTLNSLFRGEKPAQSNLEWILVDKSNVPRTGVFEGSADFRAAYRTAWGLDG